MYCPTCGNEITVELKYCNRCGANLSLPMMAPPVAMAPVKITLPSIMLGLTILGGLGVIAGASTEFAQLGVHPFAIVWIVLFSSAALFGCIALMIRFFTKMLSLQQGVFTGQPSRHTTVTINDRQPAHHLPPPRMEPVPSVTENTTRTFSPIYREPADRGTR
ncbi:MAG TPA: zinc ribbon domain-containing protein [Pyrinomonadaceae bacterium]|jgi:hypothetical protein|nr:zinc ribbon domain-containing protein [Pyrinomonadaceae bacterium]